MCPNECRSANDNNAPLTQAPPPRFAAKIMDADPGDREDELSEKNTGDDDEDPD